MIAAAALAALSLTAAACGGADDDVAVSTGGFVGDSVLDASVLSGTVADINGDDVDLATLANKDLVVWFWAPW